MAENEKEGQSTQLAKYGLNANGMPVEIEILQTDTDFVPIYTVTIPGLGEATKLLLLSLRSDLISSVPIDPSKIPDKRYQAEIRARYVSASSLLIDRNLPGTSSDTKELLVAYIVNMMLGLGDLEAPLADPDLEEITVNGANNQIWVFHKKFGWCKTNIKPASEEVIYDQASQIGRTVGREINNLNPLMDAALPDGSRVNATLYPVSETGNTITIRKFAKNPWTMTALIQNKTTTPEVGALIWLCIQNEISLLIAGGTASGKTSLLNASSIFFPPNRRVISVEETRELTLPDTLQWVPMVTRQPNPEGKGEITLYDLTINALRQRPDIVVVGEVRVQKDAETLFEAIHTGHAVYGTVHAENAQDTIVRMTNPPIGMPKIMMNSIGGIVVAFRHRTKGIRRILEYGEVLRSGDVNVLYRWNLRDDTITQISELTRLAETLSMYSGYNTREITDEIAERTSILRWMVDKNVLGVNDSGLVISNYYRNKERVLEIIKSNAEYSKDMFIKGY
ncbi:Flp pilus assembly complex ATPase component TadA [Candidatus Marsarchaeota archaeon]|nr:Flp pilus assembly complex ATPase component TadA [Candidatus Marsarchaeota archaeon]